MTEIVSNMIKRLSGLRPELTFRSRPRRSERDGFKNWFSGIKREPIKASPDIHNSSSDNTSPRTGNNHRAIMRLPSWRKEPAVEHPDNERRKSPIKRFLSRSSISGRRSMTNRSRNSPSPEQEAAAASSVGKTPPRRPFSWASRGTRDLTVQWVYSQNELQAVYELGNLIKLQTASPAYTLKRLASCEAQLKQNNVHRAQLLETAKMAVQAAHGEFNRASHAARQRECKEGGDGAFGSTPTVQFADATDLRTFAGRAKLAANDLDNGLSEFEIFRNMGMQFRRAAAELNSAVEIVARGSAAVEVMEIW